MKLITLHLLVSEDEIKRGSGEENDPHRTILRAETLDGQIFFEYDVHKDQVSMTAFLIDVLKNAPRELSIIK